MLPARCWYDTHRPKDRSPGAKRSTDCLHHASIAAAQIESVAVPMANAACDAERSKENS